MLTIVYAEYYKWVTSLNYKAEIIAMNEFLQKMFMAEYSRMLKSTAFAARLSTGHKYFICVSKTVCTLYAFVEWTDFDKTSSQDKNKYRAFLNF